MTSNNNQNQQSSIKFSLYSNAAKSVADKSLEKIVAASRKLIKWRLKDYRNRVITDEALFNINNIKDELHKDWINLQISIGQEAINNEKIYEYCEDHELSSLWVSLLCEYDIYVVKIEHEQNKIEFINWIIDPLPVHRCHLGGCEELQEDRKIFIKKYYGALDDFKDEIQVSRTEKRPKTKRKVAHAPGKKPRRDNAKGNMGMSKHRKSGTPGKSPKARHELSREAQSNDRNSLSLNKASNSVKELFENK